MSDNYILFTDSGADIPPSLLSEWGVGYQPLTFRFDHIDKEFSNDEMDIREFYRLMREGHIAKTSAVASAIFKDTFEAILAEGKDILYLAFSSGLSATCNNGRVAAADGDERFGVFRIQPEIRRSQHKLRAFAQRHADRLAGGDAEFFRGDGLGEDDAGALVPVAPDGGGDGAQVRFACGDAARRLPGQKGTVDVYVKDQPLLHPAPSFGFRYVRSSWFRKQYSTNWRNMRTKFRKFYRVR